MTNATKQLYSIVSIKCKLSRIKLLTVHYINHLIKVLLSIKLGHPKTIKVPQKKFRTVSLQRNWLYVQVTLIEYCSLLWWSIVVYYDEVLLLAMMKYCSILWCTVVCYDEVLRSTMVLWSTMVKYCSILWCTVVYYGVVL